MVARADHEDGAEGASYVELAIEDFSVPVDPTRLGRVLDAVWAGEGRRLSVSIVVVGDERIRDVNREFLGHDWETDVIAFDLEADTPSLPGEVDGEIFVNGALALREGTSRGHGGEAELLFYVAHGLLHLLGYDDALPAERRAMWQRQKAYLSQVGIRLARDDADLSP